MFLFLSRKPARRIDVAVIFRFDRLYDLNFRSVSVIGDEWYRFPTTKNYKKNVK